MAMIWTVAWQQAFGAESQASLVAYSLLVYAAITFCIMLVERVPETLVLPVIFASLAILLWASTPGYHCYDDSLHYTMRIDLCLAICVDGYHTIDKEHTHVTLTQCCRDRRSVPGRPGHHRQWRPFH